MEREGGRGRERKGGRGREREEEMRKEGARLVAVGTRMVDYCT
jgi:hypothetical protein